jgi:hypothetical protein
MVYGAILLSVELSGCSSSGNAKLLDDGLIDQIRSKSTTQQQVRQMIGVPASETSMVVNGQTVASWTYTYLQKWMNPLLFVPVINLIVIACCKTSEHETRLCRHLAKITRESSHQGGSHGRAEVFARGSVGTD